MPENGNNIKDSWIYQLVQDVDIYFTEVNTAHVTSRILVILFSLVSTVITIADVFKTEWTRVLGVIILLIIIITLSIVDFGHVKLARDRRHLLMKKNNTIDILRLRIDFIAKKLLQPYRLSLRKAIMEIDPSGSMVYTREMQIVSVGQPVSMIWLKLGATNEAPNTEEKLNMKVVNSKGETLQTVITQDRPMQKEALIVLNPAADNGQNSHVTCTAVWPEIWKPLIMSGEDNGTLDVRNDIDELILEFILPLGKVFTGFHIEPSIGNHEIIRTNDNRSLLRFKAHNLKVNNSYISYTYRLTCRDEISQ